MYACNSLLYTVIPLLNVMKIHGQEKLPDTVIAYKIDILTNHLLTYSLNSNHASQTNKEKC